MTESFIEKQFPVSKISKESYREREAKNGQTLTGLGKWWGRKPLILVRAAILGALMPTSDNQKRDMEIFQKILSIDNHGLLLRQNKTLSIRELYDISKNMPLLKNHILEWFDDSKKKIELKKGVDKSYIEKKIFSNMGYDKKIKLCVRPEQLKNLDEISWKDINSHLDTSASNIWELIEQLSIKQFGHNVVIGDCFSGGGSIPFEASRIGCDVYASDLNPVAGVLTWSDINICGSSPSEIDDYTNYLKTVYEKVQLTIDDLGVEENEAGDKAISYLYCLETTCPECGKKVPLLPNYVIGRGTKTIVSLIDDENGYDFHVEMGVTDEEMKKASVSGTLQSNNLICPHCGKVTPLSSIRKDVRKDGVTTNSLRKWDKTDFDFKEGDIYQERLYAIKYLGKDGNKYYESPSKRDLENERIIKDYIKNNIENWQINGYIPSSEIEEGLETRRLTHERGWKYWHQLFNPRQLFINGLFSKISIETASTKNECVVSMLGLNKLLDWNSNLSRWIADGSNEKGAQTFYNQAFNTIFNHVVRGSNAAKTSWFYSINQYPTSKKAIIELNDASLLNTTADIWITDPPYADAISYHELSEFFLSWDKKFIQKAFPNWYYDSKRILAVKGDEDFSNRMIEIYSNLSRHMTDNGLQIVMFTHSDAGVWAQLALIMWKSGLKVTAAWNISTETESVGIKSGNYVKGTVLLVLRKQSTEDIAYLNEINDDIKTEVKKQIKSMQELDEKDEPNFSDPDYVLAAYAASLKILTSYKKISGLNIEKELDSAIKNPSDSKIVKIIENAKKTAYDCIIPSGFDSTLWKELNNAERFYIKGLESEKFGEYQISTYQEYARGFSITNYKPLMADQKANSARLKTPTELAMREIKDVPGFEYSLLRKILAAIYIIIKEENEKSGLGQLKSTLDDYWNKRELILELLSNIKETSFIENMKHWKESAEAAEHLYTLVENDHI